MPAASPHPALSPDAYCALRTRQSGSSFYSSFFILPPAKRRGMMALYAFCREVDDLVDEVADGLSDEAARLQAESQLIAWQTCLQRLAAQPNPEALAQEHPIAQALATTAQTFGLPYDDLQLVITGMKMDLIFTPYADWSALFVYCDRVAGVVGRLAARIFGFAPAHETAVLRYATALGRALQLVNILRDGREDRQRRRIYIPQSLWPAEFSWAAFNDPRLTPAQLDVIGQTLYSAAMVEEFFAHINTAFAEAKAALPASEAARQRSGVVMGRVYEALYQKMLATYRANPSAARQSLAQSTLRLPAWQKWWLMVSTLIFRRSFHG